MSRDRAVPEPVAAAKVDRIDEIKALYRLTDRLYRARGLSEVYEAALDAIEATLGARRASILLFDAGGTLRFVAWRGLSEGYREKVEGHSPWRAGARDPQPIFVSDIERTDEPAWIRQAIAAEGVRALAFIPLVARGDAVGKFMIYYPEPRAFGDHDRGLSVTIARQVGLSIEREQTERARQSAEEALRESERRFRTMAEHAPVMIWMSDAGGACLHLNRMLREFWGVKEGEVAGFDWQATVHPDDAPALAQRTAGALARRERLRVKARFRNAAGEYRLLDTDAQPRFSAGGGFLGMIGVNIDVTERDRVEAELRASEERFRRVVEAAPSGMLMCDGDGRIVMINANAERILGYRGEELVGQPVESLVPERFRPTHPGYRSSYATAPTVRSMGEGRELFALRKDGSEVPVEIALSPIETRSGRMTIATVVDIGARKRAEAERELLLAELNHRVKNTLAVVQGIAHQTFRDGGGAEARDAFEARLAALAAAHNLLTQAKWEHAALWRLATEALHGSGVNLGRVEISGPPILLRPKEALGISMALHELCTNALKYGALSNEGGRVALGWRQERVPRPGLTVVWRETGGPPVAPPSRNGFGTFLLERALARDLGGTVRIAFDPAGVVCTIEAPLRNGAA